MPQPQPLVSVIVRSMARPSLEQALASIAAQNHPAIEILVVAAAGPAHAPVHGPCGPHRVHFVASERRLPRPVAANTGVERASGQWITLLDDDDVWLPGHVAGLVQAAQAAPQHGVVYSYARGVFADGHIERFGQPFSLMQLYERNFISIPTGLVARTLFDQGCRFDESLDMHEDWDLMLQCAQRTSFLFVPHETFQWNADAGTSGGGGGANQDDRRFAEFRDRVYAKWAGSRDALIDKVRALLESAMTSIRAGNSERAEMLCREALAASPNDPFALNLLGMIQRTANRLVEARATMELAAAVRPQDPSMAYNAALVCQACGDVDAAIAQCDAALEQDRTYAAALRLRASLAAGRRA